MCVQYFPPSLVPRRGERAKPSQDGGCWNIFEGATGDPFPNLFSNFPICTQHCARAVCAFSSLAIPPLFHDQRDAETIPQKSIRDAIGAQAHQYSYLCAGGQASIRKTLHGKDLNAVFYTIT